MPQVSLTFNKRTYKFQCGDGEAERLEQLANYVKQKLDALTIEHGAIGDERLVLMAALTIADELFDARQDVDQLLEGAGDHLRAAAASGSPGANPVGNSSDQAEDSGDIAVSG